MKITYQVSPFIMAHDFRSFLSATLFPSILVGTANVFRHAISRSVRPRVMKLGGEVHVAVNLIRLKTITECPSDRESNFLNLNSQQ